MPAAVGATPARVMSSASSCEPDAHLPLVLLDDDDGARAGALHHAEPQPRGGQRGEQRVGDLAQVGDADAGRPQPLHQAGRRAAEPGVGHCGGPVAEHGPDAVGQAGHGEHAGPLGGAEADRQHVVVPAGRAPDARGRGGPHRVAGGGHVQLGEHVLEVDRGHRVQQPLGQRRADRGGQLRALLAGSQCGTRISEPGPSAGSALTRARPGGRTASRAPGLGAAAGRREP